MFLEMSKKTFYMIFAKFSGFWGLHHLPICAKFDDPASGVKGQHIFLHFFQNATFARMSHVKRHYRQSFSLLHLTKDKIL